MDITKLPLDARVHIASFLSRQSDLRSLRDTCRSLYDAVIPRLYRRMVIPDDISIGKLAAVLSPDNAGLKHIRHLEIVSSCGDYHRKKPELDTVIIMLGNLLPRNGLLTFTLDACTPIDYLVIRALYERQQNLSTARWDGGLAIITGVLDMDRLTTLHLEIFNTTIAKHSGDLLQELRSLLHLEIRFDKLQYCNDGGFDFQVKQGRESASREAISRVFVWPLTTAWRPLRLRTLRLYNFDLTTAAEDIAKAVMCSRLHSLTLQKCHSNEALLRLIRPTGVPARMNLQTLILTGHSEDRTDDAIDDFLGSFSGLEKFIVDANGCETLRPSGKALAVHAKTLRFLYLDAMWDHWPEHDTPNMPYFDPKDLKSTLQQCEQLEQLALATPEIDLENSKQEIEIISGDFMDALAAAPALKTFRALTAPASEDQVFEVFDDPAYHTWAKTGLQRLATTYFGKVPNLNALSLVHTNQDEMLAGELKIKPHFYGRGKVVNAYRKEEPIALDMRKEELQDIEPVSEILALRPVGWRMLREG